MLFDDDEESLNLFEFPNYRDNLFEISFEDGAIQHSDSASLSIDDSSTSIPLCLSPAQIDIQKVEKKKRIRVRKRTPPKVFKCDIRRFYCQMLTNVFNSSNLQLMSQFFRSCAVPNVSMSKDCNSSMKCFSDRNNVQVSPHYLREVGLSGTNQLTKYWYFLTKLNPDSSFETKNTYIKTKIGSSTSIIVSDFQSQFTAIYSTPPCPFFLRELVEYNMYDDWDQFLFPDTHQQKRRRYDNDDINTISTTIPQPTTSVHPPTGTDSPSIRAFPYAEYLPLRLLPQPIPITIQGKLIIHINEAKQIERFEFTAISINAPHMPYQV
jgi:hypothetical protein